MTDEYIRKHDAIAVAESYQVERTGFHLNDYEYGRNQVADSIASDLEDIEPADVAPIVRCKDCIHNNDCDIQYSAQAGENFFCGFGETEKDVREDVYE